MPDPTARAAGPSLMRNATFNFPFLIDGQYLAVEDAVVVKVRKDKNAVYKWSGTVTKTTGIAKGRVMALVESLKYNGEVAEAGEAESKTGNDVPYTPARCWVTVRTVAVAGDFPIELYPD